MKFKLFATAAILVLNAYQTHTEESFFKKIFTPQPMSDEMRFPHLSQLPKRSIIRQQCLNSPLQPFVKNGSPQSACDKLENHIRKHAAGKGAWRYGRKKVEDSPELEKKALDYVHDDFSKQVAIISQAIQLKFEAYLRKKQEIDPEKNQSATADWESLIHREYLALGGLCYMTQKKYEAKHTLDEATRQKNLTEAARVEEAFATIDSKAAPDDFVVK
jgi:hypothetical protein